MGNQGTESAWTCARADGCTERRGAGAAWNLSAALTRRGQSAAGAVGVKCTPPERDVLSSFTQVRELSFASITLIYHMLSYNAKQKSKSYDRLLKQNLITEIHNLPRQIDLI